ncbi:MAG: alpha/beta hydrolase [Brevundimonas sp.]|uniref:alpha/beta hydrolase n=1 Tax=Brevundimonas sp. TaxID=1871086 RepID=UPI00275D53E9|nr:alpha/beta hydrolase [Brevundimonas sp.]MDP3399584.1 alpha/beta hydrolase [Brevundimonas sp.]MDZ4110318.1 alpha/beta hydrolase [Brevundimonas sp.]
MLDRRQALGLTALGLISPGLVLADEPEPEILRLWPGAAPGGDGVTVTPEVVERSTDPAFHDRIAKHTGDPLLTVVRSVQPNGVSMLLIPGGGYRWAVVDKEGMDCARVFAAMGYTCYVLRYRLPADGWAAGPDAPLQDAQRALRLVRAHAVAEGRAADRTVVLGASAGGHLAGLLGARSDATYAAVDAADQHSHRPDALILLYPVATLTDPFAHAGSRRELLGESPSPDQISAYSLEQMDWTGAAPTFLLHAMDDTAVPVENSLMLSTTLRQAEVPAEVHLFEEGGHGFGIRLIEGRPAAVWPDLVQGWLARRGL